MRRIATLLMICACAALLLAGITSTVRADARDDYDSAINRAYSLMIDAMQADSPEAELALRKQAADVLEAVAYPSLDGGSQLAVDNRALTEALRNPDVPLDDAILRLETLTTALARFAPKNGDDAVKTLSRVRGDAVRDWWQETFERVGMAIRDLLAPLLRGAGTAVEGIVSSRVFVIGGVLLLVAVAAYFGRNLSGKLSAESSVTLPEAETDAPTTSNAAIERAEAMALAGDFRTAVRQLYLGALLILDERGKLKFDRALTNRETIRAVRNSGSHTLADSLRPIVDYYDRVWYGFARVEQGDYERYRAQVEEVKSA